MRQRTRASEMWLALIVGTGSIVGCGSERPQTNNGNEGVAATSTTTSSSPTSGASPSSTPAPTTAVAPTGSTGVTSSNATGATGPSGGTGGTGDTGGTASTMTEASGDPAPDTSEGASGSSTEGPAPTGSETAGGTTDPGSGVSSSGGETDFGEDIPGECSASQATGQNATGTGPHDVIIETNGDDGIRCGTIYRPADLGGSELYPIFVWGEGGCSQDGYSNRAAMAEIASWGYFVVADGTPGQQGACEGRQNGAALLDYITWAIAENNKPCSAYYHSLQTKKIAADGFSCGGLMAENVAGDPRFSAIGITSSGLMGANNNLWDSMHAPFKIMNGGSSDVAYQNGLNDYDAISSRDIPILYFSKSSAGHGGDLGQGRGDFNLVNLAWINWQLKGDEGATGKAFLIGPTCEFCNDPGWDFKSANIE